VQIFHNEAEATDYMYAVFIANVKKSLRQKGK